jgi:hypothetical protein
MYMAKNPTLGCGVKARPVCRKFEMGVFSMRDENQIDELEEQANQERLIAHEIISRLYKAKLLSHLRLLLNHCQSSILEIETDKEASDE